MYLYLSLFRMLQGIRVTETQITNKWLLSTDHQCKGRTFVENGPLEQFTEDSQIKKGSQSR